MRPAMNRKAKRASSPATRILSIPARVPLPRWKLWCFRGFAALVLPIALLAILEVTLRLFGFGHPTAFLLSTRKDGREYLVQNNQFGWRFFGRRMARAPHPI